MAAILEDGSLTLSGYVGDDFFGDGFTASDVLLALAQIEDSSTLTVYLNSGGGIASEGAAIQALFSRRQGTTDVVVDGIAASAASLIAMSGDTVTMSTGAVMMIHDPASFTFGNSSEHSKTIEMLEAFATSYARIYALKSGKTDEECRTIMKAEKWMNPDEAVAEGFADAVGEGAAKAVAAFDYRVYQHAPKRLTALAAKKNWRLPDAGSRTTTSGSPRHKEEHTMTEKTTTADNAAELEKAKTDAGKAAVMAYQTRRKSVMAMEEAKGREALAEYLLETDLSEDAIKASLAAAPTASATEPNPVTEHERRRLNGDGLNVNGGNPTAKGDKSVLAAAVARTNKRR